MPEEAGYDVMALLPLFFINIPFWIICIRLARRKARNVKLYAWTGWIPYLGFCYALYLVGITDQDVYNKLDEIVARLDDGESQPLSQPQ